MKTKTAKTREWVMQGVFTACACISILAVVLICVFLFANGLPTIFKIGPLDFLLGTAVINRVSCAMVTYQNTATLSLSKQTLDPSFEDALYVLLTRDGLVPRVEGSPVYEN